MNYCTDVHINGGEAADFPALKVWEGHISYGLNVGQRCHATEMRRETAPDRTACQENSIYFLGHNTSQFIALCPRHWHQLQDVLTGELSYADSDDHWLIRPLVNSLRRRLHEQAQVEYDASEIERRHERERTRDASVLAAQLIQGPVVYFVQYGKRGPIKIGYASNIAKRLAALQTGSPYRLRLRATVPGDIYTEGAYHGMFAEYRLAGEWFKPVAAIRTEIERINKISRRGDGALF